MPMVLVTAENMKCSSNIYSPAAANGSTCPKCVAVYVHEAIMDY